MLSTRLGSSFEEIKSSIGRRSFGGNFSSILDTFTKRVICHLCDFTFGVQLRCCWSCSIVSACLSLVTYRVNSALSHFVLWSTVVICVYIQRKEISTFLNKRSTYAGSRAVRAFETVFLAFNLPSAATPLTEFLQEFCKWLVREELFSLWAVTRNVCVMILSQLSVIKCVAMHLPYLHKKCLAITADSLLWYQVARYNRLVSTLRISEIKV